MTIKVISMQKIFYKQSKQIEKFRQLQLWTKKKLKVQKLNIQRNCKISVKKINNVLKNYLFICRWYYLFITQNFDRRKIQQK